METDPPKKTWILKHQRAGSGVEDEMIMFAGQMVGGFGREFAGHAEVNAQPAVVAEAKEHLFAVGLDGTELLPGQTLGKVGWTNSPEDSFARVEMNSGDLFAETGSPLLCKVKYLRQFRHGERVRGSGKKSKLGWGKPCDILDGWRRN